MKLSRMHRSGVLIAAAVLLGGVTYVAAQQRGAQPTGQRGGNGAPAPATSSSPARAGANAAVTAGTSAATDPVLAAMGAELDRSKTQLKMDNVPAPYYMEYHVTDVEQYDAESAFGALRISQHTHQRTLRVVVRVGDYNQDSYSGPGGGMGVLDYAPLDGDAIALRRALWLASDRAYKQAAEALAGRQAQQAQFSGGQEFADFAHAQPLQSIGPLVKIETVTKPWTDMLVNATALYKTDPKLQSLSASMRFRVTNEYFVNSEGTVTRHGSEVDSLSLSGTTQAADGMRLSRSPDFVAAKVSDLPSAEQFQAAMTQMVSTLKALRDAPLVEEDYRGPVLFAPDASSDLMADLVGGNVLGIRPRAGDTSRTAGNFASSYKSRVLPTFLSVTDDPTLTTFQGKSLVGSYMVDDEGVRAAKVPVIENGMLTNYLVGRVPIRDFPVSNGHGRAATNQATRPSVGTLIVQSNEPVSAAELKKKLMDMCRDQNKPYGYFAETLVLTPTAGGGRGPGGRGPVSFELEPVLLYRVYVQDGHEELIRGAVFDELDTRSLRNDVTAAGNDPIVSNRATAIPVTVIAPSILFDELEVRRSSAKDAKQPEYSAPDLSSTAGK